MSDLQLTRLELIRRRRLARDVGRFEPTANARATELRTRRTIRPRQRAPRGSGRAAR